MSDFEILGEMETSPELQCRDEPPNASQEDGTEYCACKLRKGHKGGHKCSCGYDWPSRHLNLKMRWMIFTYPLRKRLTRRRIELKRIELEKPVEIKADKTYVANEFGIWEVDGYDENSNAVLGKQVGTTKKGRGEQAK